MRLVLKLLWVILGGGIVIALQYALGALLLCLTIVGIPFGVQCLKIAALALWPFGAVVERGHAQPGCLGVGLNVLWAVVAGIWIFLSHLALGVSLALTLIGIPFALQ